MTDFLYPDSFLQKFLLRKLLFPQLQDRHASRQSFLDLLFQRLSAGPVPVRHRVEQQHFFLKFSFYLIPFCVFAACSVFSEKADR